MPAPAQTEYHRLGAALARALGEMGRTPDDLHAMMAAHGHAPPQGVLRSWCEGRAAPTRPEELKYLAYAEMELDLSPGQLLGQLIPASAATRSAPTADAVDQPVDVATVFPRAAEVRKALIDLRLRVGSPRQIELYDKVYIDRHRNAVRHVSRQVMEATVDAQRGFPVIRIMDEPTNATAGLAVLRGGRLGETWSDLRLGVYAAEVCFDRPLNRGERADVELEFRPPTQSVVAFNHERVLAHKVALLRMKVFFAAGVIPTRIYGFTSAGRGEHTIPLGLIDDTRCLFELRDIGPGTAGIYWDW